MNNLTISKVRFSSNRLQVLPDVLVERLGRIGEAFKNGEVIALGLGFLDKNEINKIKE